MLAGRHLLLCLLFWGWVSAAAGESIEAFVPLEILQHAMSRLEFADLRQVSRVSTCFCRLAYRILRPGYCVEHDGKTYLNYTRLLADFDRLVENARAEDYGAYQIEHIQRTLEAEFGYCIRHSRNRVPQFCLFVLHFNILADPRKMSVLAHALDQRLRAYEWVSFVSWLIELGQTDILGQMTFGKINTACFRKLMRFALPESVVGAAVKALRQNEPASELILPLAAAGFGSEPGPLPENCSIPLFVFRYMHERGAPLPERFILVDGLQESSIPFWMHVLEQRAEEAQALLHRVMVHGDDKSKPLASAVYGPVSAVALSPPERAVYEDMLIRFRFSRICNDNVVGNYSRMLKELKVHYRATRALLDCGQYSVVDECGFYPMSEANLELLIDRMYRHRDAQLDLLIQKCVRQLKEPLKLLKCLIKRKANRSYSELVWNSICTFPPTSTSDDCSSFPPLDVLEALMFEQNIPIDSVRKMLGVLAEHEIFREQATGSASTLYTLMFWEAPENAIKHFLDLLPSDYMLDVYSVRVLLLSTKYSSGLCHKLIQCLPPMLPADLVEFLEYRPDLIGKES